MIGGISESRELAAAGRHSSVAFGDAFAVFAGCGYKVGPIDSGRLTILKRHAGCLIHALGEPGTGEA